jgi:hypothetical protein
VQFHPEVTPDIVEGWATSPTSRLGETGQTVAGLRELSESHAPAAGAAVRRLRRTRGHRAARRTLKSGGRRTFPVRVPLWPVIPGSGRFDHAPDSKDQR